VTYPSDPPPLTPRPQIIQTAVRHLPCGLISHLDAAVAPSVARHPQWHARLWCDGCAAWCPRGEFRWRDGTVIAHGDDG